MADKSDRPSPSPDQLTAIDRVLAQVPTGLFVLTSATEDRRIGMLCSMVHQVCFEPPMVAVCIAKGKSVMPLISESRAFGLIQLGEDDRALMRKFEKEPRPGDDPFLGYELVQGATPEVPIIRQGIGYLQCELVTHLDLESDHDLFVGSVFDGGPIQEGVPKVSLRRDGYGY